MFSRSIRLANASTIVAAMVLLASCASSPTPYGPASGSRGYGYSDQQIEQNRYRITFKGNSATQANRVEDYLLYRAAQIAKAQGYDHFIVASMNSYPTGARSSSPRISIGGFGFGGGSTSVGGGGGVTFGGGGRDPAMEYQTYADVVLMKGPKPQAEPRAFSADEVIARIGPTIRATDAAKR